MTELLLVLLAGALSIAGTLLGARSTRKTARDLAADERSFADRQAVRARQDAVAAEFDERLHSTLASVPRGVVTGPAVGEDRPEADRLAEAIDEVRRAWQRTIILDDPEIEARVRAVDMTMFIGRQDVSFLSEGEEVNLYPIEVAVRDLRRALGAFQRHEPIPESEGPAAKALIKLAHPSGA